MTPYLTARALHPPLIHERPSPLLGIVVVIPCYDEEYLLLSLMSLKKCHRPACDVEVIVVINQTETTPEAVKQTNARTYRQAIKWAGQNRPPHLRFRILFMDDMPKKHAGVGLARKVGMDEACYRFHKAGNPRGIIACFDADSRCEVNYFQALENYFIKKPKAVACGIHFEHPLSGVDFGEKIYEAITFYELHLRYYVQAQRWAGFPHAWQTIGSSMAVRCDAYQKQGGMNRRQAGEDFYFLHKFIPLGHFGEITETTVIPSPRPSDRVPFGTGKAVADMLRTKNNCTTYNPKSFQDIAVLFKKEWPGLYNLKNIADIYGRLPRGVSLFLKENNFIEKIKEIKAHTSSKSSFEKRLWRWFDAFLMMKYVHFSREHFYADIEVTEAAKWLLGNILPDENHSEKNAKELLLLFRESSGKGGFPNFRNEAVR
ncbi:MAG TPA: glycosyltransferase [Bacteroidetes bacterium]|nr:glycosyltransferase [Bacteroidota bacterium]